MTSGAARWSWRSHWHWAIPTVVIAVLALPLLSDRTFASDWGNHLWLVNAQAANISHLGLPSYYLQSDLGAFYPYYAFYGGTLYAVLGYGAWLFGANASVVIASFLALATAYLAWTWIAVQAGIRGWLIQIPGALAVTTPYAISNNFGRGGIPEMIGCSMIALVAAAGISLFRAERVRVLPAVAFVVGLVFLTGSHVLTTIWGVTFLVVVGAIMVAADWRSARRHAKRGLRLLWLALLAFGINAWILVPQLLLHSRTLENAPDPMSQLEYSSPHQLFSLFRDTGPLNPLLHSNLNAQLPVLAMIWALAFGAFFWAYLSPARRLTMVGLGLFGGFLLLLILRPSSIVHLPSFLKYIQFPYRLLTYIDLAVVGVTTLAIAAMQRAGTLSRVPAALLAIVAGLSFWAAIDQNEAVYSWLPSRAAAVASVSKPPESWYAPVQFGDSSAPIARRTLPGVLKVPVDEGIRRSYTVTVPPGKEGIVLTNVVTGTYFVSVSGAEPVGRNKGGDMLVRLPASNRPRRVTFASHHGAEVTAGIWITAASLLIAAIALMWGIAGSDRLPWSRRRSDRTASHLSGD